MTYVLGSIRYTSRAGPPQLGPGGLTMDVHLTAAGQPDAVDVWTTTRPVALVPGRHVRYAHDGETGLFAAGLPRSPRYATAVRNLYIELFAVTAAAGYPHIFRVWQYIEDINGPNADGLENYRDYCAGRAAAFERRGGTASMPAATGVGARSGGVSVHLLAGRTGPRPIENPRQLPAYRYPRQYGPKPPSFARATWCDGALYVAGTSSIVGHRSVHADDAAAQCRTTLANIEELLDRNNLARHGVHATMGLTDLDRIKVYVRRAADVAAVREICGSAFDAHAAVSFIVIDLCRADLLIEIEGIVWASASHHRAPAASRCGQR